MSGPTRPGGPPRDEANLSAPGAEDEDEEEHQFAVLADRRRLSILLLAFVLLIVAIYVLFPKVVGLDEEIAELDEARWYWLVIAIGFNVAAFAAYVALFRGVLGAGKDEERVRRRLTFGASYEITMAGLAATRLFSAAGAGGIALTYWALRRAGMERRRAACRMVAFLVLQYVVYLAALVIFGVLLRTGVLPGDNPVGGTIVPAALAGSVLVLLALVALLPQDVEERLGMIGKRYSRVRRVSEGLAKVPATLASGVRTAWDYISHPNRGALAVGGAVFFWAAQIGILWACFEAFNMHVPVGVLVQGFFVGMAANLIPSPAGGVGSVDAGMIAAFILFGLPEGTVFTSVLAYRVIAFWLPIPPGIVAFVQLRQTVRNWRREDGYTPKTSESKVTAEATT